jgi:TolB-like protein
MSAEAGPPEADPDGDPADLTAALRDQLHAFSTACDEAGGRWAALGARSAGAYFSTPNDALDALEAAQRALSPPFGAPDFGFRIGLGLGVFAPDGAAEAAERPAGDAEPGEIRASLAFVELARTAGPPVAFAHIGPRRPWGGARTIETFRLLDDPRAATAAPAWRPATAATGVALIAPAFRRIGPESVPRWIGEGFAADVATRLARARGLALLAPGAAERAAGPGAPALEAAARLGARYAVEGEIRREGGALVATARLIAVETGQVAWSAQRCAAIDDLMRAPPALADELAAALSAGVTALAAEAAPKDPRAYNLALRAEAAMAREGATAEAAGPAIAAALALDPRYARALALRARWLCEGWRRGTAGLPRRPLTEALDCARRAVATDPLDARAHAALAEALRLSGDAAGALDAAETACTRDSNDIPALTARGRALGLAGRAAEAEAALARVMRLDPFFPDDVLAALGAVRFNGGDAAGAVEALSRMGEPGEAGWLLAAALAATGDGAAAARAAARAGALFPEETPQRNALALGVADGAAAARLKAAFA